MIAPVSFRSVAASSNTNFQDKIKQPQTYIVKEEQPSASAPLNSNKEKGKGGKFVGVLAFLAATATAVGVLASKGKFAALANGADGFKKTLFTHLDTVGKFIADKASFVKEKVVNFAKDLPSKLEKIKPNAKKAAEQVADA